MIRRRSRPAILSHALVRILLTTDGACTNRCDFPATCLQGSFLGPLCPAGASASCHIGGRVCAEDPAPSGAILASNNQRQDCCLRSLPQAIFLMASSPRRSAITVAVFLAACAAAGTLVQRTVGAQAQADESTLRNDLRSFTTVYSLVEQNYAEPLDGDKAERAIYDGAIPGMLRVLDPHSSFYDPKAYAKMREEQHGKYYGVGMTTQPQNNKIVVLFPYEDTPSFRAGLKPADVIVAVDGKPTDNMDSTEVANMLKGPKGTHVSVTVTRYGQPKPLTFDLVRDEIPHGSIDLTFMIKPGIGYIHITQFQETTGHEVGEALDNFGPNLKGLVLDLRSNPGGLLTEAVSVCDKFLQKGQVIVSQRGRAYPEQTERATHGNGGRSLPLGVLGHHGTRSG